jgi:hypothetical protein
MRSDVELDPPRAPHTLTGGGSAPQAELATLGSRNALQISHHPQIADLALGVDGPAIDDDGFDGWSGGTPLVLRISVEILAPTSEPQGKRSGVNRAVGLVRVLGPFDPGDSRPAFAAEPLGPALGRPVARRAEDPARIHQDRMGAPWQVALHDEASADGRRDVFAGASHG